MKYFTLISLPILFLSCLTPPPVIVKYPSPIQELPAATAAAPSKPVKAATPPPEVDYETHPDATDEPVPQADSEKIVDAATAEMTVGPTKRTYDGGAVQYPFVDGRQYKIFSSPGHQTNIVLQPGENILGQPVTGDNSSFIMTNLLGKEGGLPVVNLFVIAKMPGRTTNVTVLTDRRTYRFILSSYSATYMPVIKFTYDFDSLVSFGGQVDAQGKPTPANGGDVYLYAKIENLDFNYAILPRSINKPAWAPTQVFTDGVSTYMQFASAKGAAFAPIFVVLDEKNKPVIVNYRVKGIFYVIDRVIERAQILLNKNDGNVIDIIRKH